MKPSPAKLNSIVWNIAHETLYIIAPKIPGEIFETWSQRGGQNFYYVQLHRKRKSSEMSVNQIAKYECQLNTILSKIRSVVTGEKYVSTYYKRSKYDHIIMNENGILNLRLSGNMTETSWLPFYWTLKKCVQIDDW